jgi:hypothetical protein
LTVGSDSSGEAMITDEPGESSHPKRVLYERIFVDRAFAEDAFGDRPVDDAEGAAER